MSEQAKTDECLLHNIAATVDADTTTSDVAEPRVSPCCQPAEFAETVTIVGSSLGNHWLYARSCKCWRFVGEVVTIAANDRGPAKCSAARDASGMA